MNETRILNVPLATVNDELALRKRFGWRLIASSARSQVTGINTLGAGTTVGKSGLLVGGSHGKVNTKESVDLHLERALGPTGQALQRLEHDYDSTQLKLPKVKFNGIEHALLWGGIALLWAAGTGLLVLIFLLVYHAKRTAPVHRDAKQAHEALRNSILLQADQLSVAY